MYVHLRELAYNQWVTKTGDMVNFEKFRTRAAFCYYAKWQQPMWWWNTGVSLNKRHQSPIEFF